MSNDDLFAPPSKEELAQVAAKQPAAPDLFAPPTADEIKKAQAPTDDGALAAGVSGLAHGLTFQTADKLAAGGRALYDKVTGAGDYGPAYDKYLQEQKAHTAQQQAQHPYAYAAGNIGGAVFNPANALLPGGGLAGNIAGGALGGAIQGAGESSAHPLNGMNDASNFGSDVAKGAGYGALGGGIATGLGSAARSLGGLPKKAAAVFLGAPEEAVERYVANPEAVKSAPSVYDAVGQVKDKLGALKSQVGADSQASREILNAPDAAKYTGADIASFYANKLNQLHDAGQGVLTPEQQATAKYLSKYHDLFMDNADQQFTGSKLKDLIQETDKSVKYGKMPGAFDSPDERSLKGLRGDLNSQLRTDTPDYATAMDALSQKTQALNNAQGLFKSDQGLANTLNRVRRDRAPFADDAISGLDAQFPGSNTTEDLKNALAREAFEKGAQTPGGSRNVQLWSHTLGDAASEQHVPFGKAIGAGIGATVDKYGPGIARTGIDAYSGLKNMSMNPTVQSYLQAIQNGASASQLSPNINPLISDYLMTKYGRVGAQ